MKKRSLWFAPLFFLAATPLFAQDDSHSRKTGNCSGTVSADGQTFTCDKDHKIWKVSNPASLRDMEGHHAKLAFRRTAAPEEIFVTSATVVQEQTVAHNPGDSAFRR
jgi:hypothetical protein